MWLPVSHRSLTQEWRPATVDAVVRVIFLVILVVKE